MQTNLRIYGFLCFFIIFIFLVIRRFVGVGSASFGRFWGSLRALWGCIGLGCLIFLVLRCLSLGVVIVRSSRWII